MGRKSNFLNKHFSKKLITCTIFISVWLFPVRAYNHVRHNVQQDKKEKPDLKKAQKNSPLSKISEQVREK